MKISREEFKEFVGLYKETWNKYQKYAGIIDSEFLEELVFPPLYWFSKKIDWYDDNIGDWLGEYINWPDDGFFEDENGNPTRDLDIIYDKYVAARHKD